MALPTHYVVASARYGEDQGNPQLNVLWYTPSSGTPTGTGSDIAQDFATQLEDALAPLYKAVLCTEAQWYGVVASYHGPTGVYVSVASNSAGAGTITGDELPNYAATVIQKRTATAGKEGRGRWYIGAVPEAFTNTSRLTNTAISAYVTLANGLEGTVTAAGCVWKPQHHSQKNATLYNITDTVIVEYLGTQRRRRVRPVL